MAMLFGPWALALRWGLLVLLAMTLAKSAAFALLERRREAALPMLIAGAITALPGVLAALTYVFPLVGPAGMAIAAVLTWPASARIRRMPRVVTTLLAALAYAVSTVLFVGTQILVSHASELAFWATKFGCACGALLLSLGLTTMWEEHVVWRMSGRTRAHVTEVFRANAIALFGVALAVAATRIA